MIKFLYAQIFLFWLCSLSLSAAPVVKIGVNLSLAAGGAASATELRDSMLIALDELNSRPNAPYHYDLVFEDNGANSREAALVSQKLINVDKADALITVFDYAIAPTTPMAKNYRIASLGIGWGASLVDGKYSFLFGWSELSQADGLADYLTNVPHRQTVILAARQAAVPGIVARIEKRCTVAGIKEPEVIWFNREEWDFRALLLRVRETNPDCLVLLSWDNDFKKIMYQLKQMPDFKPQLVGLGFSFRFTEDRPQAAGAVFVASKGNPQALEERYEARYHRKITHEYAPYAYDGLLFLASCVEHSPSTQNLPMRQRILNTLRNCREFDGITGHYSAKEGVFDTTSKLYRLTATGEEPLAN